MSEDTKRPWNGVYPVAQPESENEDNDPLFVRAAARTVRVLSAFHDAERSLSLTEIAKAADLDRSTTQRIVHTLRKLGYLERGEHDTGFLPGIRLYDHIFDAMRLNGLIQRAIPVLLQLRDTVGERVDLSLIDDVRLVYATRFQPKRQTLHAMMLGHSVPIFCTSAGWAVLSRYDEAKARDILARSDRKRYTGQTLIDEEEILAKAELAGQQGYAVASEQLLPGEIAIGAAITDSQRNPIGAITISGMLTDWSEEEMVKQMSPMLVRAATMLGRG